MKQRKAYYSRKAGKIVAEGKRNNKTIYLFTIPSISNILKSSLFTEEKKTKIMTNYQSLDVFQDKPLKQPKKVRSINIGRTPKDNDKLDDFDPDDLIKEVQGGGK